MNTTHKGAGEKLKTLIKGGDNCTCQKVPYYSFEAANAAFKKQRNIRRKQIKRGEFSNLLTSVDIYVCPKCTRRLTFHLTSKSLEYYEAKFLYDPFFG